MDRTGEGQIIVRDYESWMEDQVVALFCQYYGREKPAQQAHFRRFFEHPFQEAECLRFVALDGDRVAGVMTYFFWPYEYGGRRLRSFQAGNALVDRTRRMKGLFRQLLSRFDTVRQDRGVDLVVGFPVEASRPGLHSNGWRFIADLGWYVRLVNPLSLVLPSGPERVYELLDREPIPIKAVPGPDAITLSQDPDFLAWRAGCTKSDLHAYFHHEASGDRLRFDLKLNRRSLRNLAAKKDGFVKEMIIGGVHTSTHDPAFVAAGLQRLLDCLRRGRIAAVLSVALNEQSNRPFILEGVRSSGFRKIKKTYCFMARLFVDEDELSKPELWNVFRGDADTW
jgi:hypothetical protein